MIKMMKVLRLVIGHDSSTLGEEDNSSLTISASLSKRLIIFKAQRLSYQFLLVMSFHVYESELIVIVYQPATFPRETSMLPDAVQALFCLPHL